MAAMLLQRIIKVGLPGLLMAGLFFSSISPSPVKSGPQSVSSIQVQLAAVSQPVPVWSYAGPAGLASLLASLDASPLALASADFDEDGMADVLAGYGKPGGGVLILERGNVDSVYPYSPEATARRLAGMAAPEPLLPTGTATGLPAAPDFLVCADFNGDGHADVLAGTRDGETITFLAGDGKGTFGAAQALALPGRLTILRSGELDTPDGLADVVAGVAGDNGPSLVIFSSPRGALNAVQAAVVPLPAPPSDLALGLFDGDALPDVIGTAGDQLFLVHGRSRGSAGESQGQPQGQPQVETRTLPFQAESVVAGAFGMSGPDLALQAADGQLYLLNYTNLQQQVNSGEVIAQASVEGFRRGNLPG